MENILINDCISIYYKTEGIRKGRKAILIDKLKAFETFIFNKLEKIKKYLNNTDYEELKEYSITVSDYNNERKTINSIINELENKYIDDSNFEYLLKIINNHFEFATELLKKDFTRNRLEIILNYLNEVTSYLEMDLEIKKLPNHIVKMNIQTK